MTERITTGKMNRRGFLAAAAAPPWPRARGMPGSPGQAPRWDREAMAPGDGFAGWRLLAAPRSQGSHTEKLKQELGETVASGNMWRTPTNLPEALQYMEAQQRATDKETVRWPRHDGAERMACDDGRDGRALGVFQLEHPQLPRAYLSNNGAGDGKLWIPIRGEVEKRGIEVLYETPAVDLVLSPSSREVLGVRATAAGKPIAIQARRGVVLACGGFEFNFEMQKQFLPGWPNYGRGTPGNTGDGIRMAQKAGAALWHMNNSLAGVGCMMVPEFEPVMIPVSIPGNGYILVDKTGRRFMSELRENRHGFGHKEHLLFFDGVIGDFTRIPCYAIFDETTGWARSLRAGQFGWFGWFNYQASRDNSLEIEKGWIIKGESLATWRPGLKSSPPS